jgi:hypothetical protein
MSWPNQAVELDIIISLWKAVGTSMVEIFGHTWIFISFTFIFLNQMDAWFPSLHRSPYIVWIDY